MERQEWGQPVTGTSMAVDDGAAPGDVQPRNSDEPAEDGNCSLFEGDLGQLAAEVRRALVVILKKRYVLAAGPRPHLRSSTWPPRFSR